MSRSIPSTARRPAYSLRSPRTRTATSSPRVAVSGAPVGSGVVMPPASRAGRPLRYDSPAWERGSPAQQLLDATDALDQVVVPQRVGQAQVAARAERLAGHHGDLDLVED